MEIVGDNEVLNDEEIEMEVDCVRESLGVNESVGELVADVDNDDVTERESDVVTELV